MRKNKYKIGFAVIICLILAASFFINGNIHKNSQEELFLNEAHTGQPAQEAETFDDKQPSESKKQVEEQSVLEQDLVQISAEESKGETEAETVPAKTSEPAQTPDDTAGLLTCSLSVSCKSVIDNFQILKESKKEIIPPNGTVFEEKSVKFFEDESIFDVLHREMKNSKIPLEFVNTPMYNSVYIEGIGNLYEFDCGEYSGWMYRVNGIKPNYSCSQYKIKSGDKIEFYYSCNFLEDR